MKSKFLNYSLLLTCAALISVFGCKKDKTDDNDNPPEEITVTDIDGNVYQTITIGTQIWMKENLKVTHYRNGDAIPVVTDDASWAALTTGAICNYDNNLNNVAVYGKLYNWYAVSDTRNLAPDGWHVPSDAEWTTLTTYLGGELAAGGKMKETGTSHWVSPNTGATNSSGFTALPGGLRSNSGTFDNMGYFGHWWSSTWKECVRSWERSLTTDYGNLFSGDQDQKCGFSIRCIKD